MMMLSATSKLPVALVLGAMALMNSILFVECTRDNHVRGSQNLVGKTSTQEKDSNGMAAYKDAIELFPDDNSGKDAQPSDNSETNGSRELVDDVCGGTAQSVLVGETIQVSSEGAASANTTTCGTGYWGEIPSNGLFFSVAGTGEGLTVEYDAEFELFISIFTGQRCDDLICVTGTEPAAYTFPEDADFPVTNGTVSWTSEANIMYYIYAHSHSGDAGQFYLTVSGGGQIPVNNKCSAAVAIESGQSIEASTQFGEMIPQICDPTYNLESLTTSAPGVWYSFTGTGENLLFTLNSTDYSSEIWLFSGESCDALTCITFSDSAFVLETDVNLVWILEEGLTYFIFVTGQDKRSGSFVLTSEVVQAPENDLCLTASELELGLTNSGSTILASVADDRPDCGTNVSSPGVWYSVEGTGDVLEVSLETHWSGPGLVASIYVGETCDTLACVQAGDTGYPTVFESQTSVKYLIHVFGVYEENRNFFNISLEKSQPPPNDICVDATTLAINGPALQGDTSAAVRGENDVGVCGDVASVGFGGVWFTFTGSGKPLLVGVNTSVSNSYFDPQMLLYMGGYNCEDLICLDGDNDNYLYEDRGYRTSLEIESAEGALYYVLVHGIGPQRGLFEVELTEMIPADNTDCTTAIGLQLGDVLYGSTYFLEKMEDDENFICDMTQGRNDTAPGVWYNVKGTGSALEAAVSSSFLTQVTVFTADDSCTSLSCIGGNSRYAGATVAWDSVADVTYYIFVHGGGPSDVGDFKLTMEEVTRPVNDKCVDAIEVDMPNIITGSTKYASYYDTGYIGDCNSSATAVLKTSEPHYECPYSEYYDEERVPGVWYTITTEAMAISEGVAAGLSVSVSNATDCNRLAVFVGDDCGNLACVTESTGTPLAFFDALQVGSQVRWSRSEESETYYVLFQMPADISGGDFELRLGEWSKRGGSG